MKRYIKRTAVCIGLALLLCLGFFCLFYKKHIFSVDVVVGRNIIHDGGKILIKGFVFPGDFEGNIFKGKVHLSLEAEALSDIYGGQDKIVYTPEGYGSWKSEEDYFVLRFEPIYVENKNSIFNAVLLYTENFEQIILYEPEHGYYYIYGASSEQERQELIEAVKQYKIR